MYSNILQYSAANPSAVIRAVWEHADKTRALQGKNAKLGEQLLLSDALTESTAGEVIRLTITGRPLDDGLFFCQMKDSSNSISARAIFYRQCPLGVKSRPARIRNRSVCPPKADMGWARSRLSCLCLPLQRSVVLEL
jgi:hypothetical protein